MLTLGFPRIDDSRRHRKAKTRPKAKLEWLARLPYQPGGHGGQLVTDALNRQPLDTATREALTPPYRPWLPGTHAQLRPDHFTLFRDMPSP
jgi:hypothetical protein